MQQRTWGERIGESINLLLLIFIAFLMFFPFWHILAVSFSSYDHYLQSEFILWPKTWVVDAYDYIFSHSRFIRAIWVTIGVTVLGTFLSLLFTTTMAYAMSRTFPGQKAIMMMVLFSFLFSAGMIPTYLVVRETMLINTIWALIIPGVISSWNLIVMRQFFRSIPEVLQEAALIDGANDLTVFWKVILPLSKPAMATFGLFYAVGYWNAYFNGILYLNKSTLWPIQVLLRQIVIVEDKSALINDNILARPPAEMIQMAAILVATVPILAIYPFIQKHFAKGVMLGSVKG
ncbi:carbohydrate ABC transporter permease [Paenibacillus eucommiae]|uniref:Aldouronate transport system permease protein n=1 Tax=Paenibacillus eucommiae TaxID=1355755 RepID=A0ABS4IM39_9BACL|nr:carbohydrate ABC transporter permease [Paenibacillus eucommiae]MBP1988629.1 putative aldouronate transport system permease protein [Paenibacillus eucommiae]